MENEYFGRLNNVDIPYPSGFSENNEVIGGYNVTLRGVKRRNIKAIKKIWTLSYDTLTTSKYDELYNEFEKENPDNEDFSQSFSVFTAYDSRLGINNENVHIDISNRSFIPGTDLLSNVSLTITQI